MRRRYDVTWRKAAFPVHHKTQNTPLFKSADFYLGELVVPAAKLKNLNAILNILQRKTIIDVDDQSDGDEDEGASAASATFSSQSGLFD